MQLLVLSLCAVLALTCIGACIYSVWLRDYFSAVIYGVVGILSLAYMVWFASLQIDAQAPAVHRQTRPSWNVRGEWEVVRA